GDGRSWRAAAGGLGREGAVVVGLHGSRGPATMMPYLREIRERVSCHVAAMPVPYRTTTEHPTFFTFADGASGDAPGARPFPTALEPFLTNRYEVARFAREAYALGIHYIAICCGNAPSYTRAVAQALGRHPEPSR